VDSSHIIVAVCVRLSTETQTYDCEVKRLRDEVASRDRTVTELNAELERVRQEISELTNRYQTALKATCHCYLILLTPVHHHHHHHHFHSASLFLSSTSD